MTEPIWDAEKGTVTLVKGDDTKTFDLNKEEDRTAIMKMGQRGWYYDEEASVELGDLRKVIKNWDNAIEAAKTSEEGREQLITKLESAGIKLTKAEKKEINEFDEFTDPKLVNTLNSVIERLEKFEKSQADFKKLIDDKETQAEVEKLNVEAAQLEKKYDGKNGTPKFVKKDVFKYQAEKGISDPELAFKMMNFDKLTEAAKTSAIAEYKKEAGDRQNAFTESGDEGVDSADLHKPQKVKSYQQLGEKAFKSAKEDGLSLFTNE